MPDDRNDRDEYYPSFGTRLRWFFVIMVSIFLLVLIAAGLGAFD